MKGEYISKDYFDSAVQTIVQTIKQDTRNQIDAFALSIKQNTKEQIDASILSLKQDTKNQIDSVKQDTREQIDSFRMAVNSRFDRVEGRLESLEDDMSKVKDVVISTDASLHNLVTELEHRDISLDRTKVFTV